jgi:predicted nuclease of predicted toxin-antitoxin system
VKFLANMGISPATVAFLRHLGHDAVHLHELGLDRMPDPDIMARACRDGQIVLTSDLGFGDLLAHSGAGLPSVIIFRLSDMRPVSVNAHLDLALQQFADDLAAGAVLSVTDRRIRVRRLPIGERQDRNL